MSAKKSSLRKFGDSVFNGITNIPGVHRWISKKLISSYADKGVLPGVYTTATDGVASLHEMLEKNYFSLEVPKPSKEELDSLPDIDMLVSLFERKGPPSASRVSLLLPFFAQHLTDAVFQSKNQYETDAPHEIILNQIYGNTEQDEKALRTGKNGRLKTQIIERNGQRAEFPDALCEQTDGVWQVKDCYTQLSYLQKEGRVADLLKKYAGREEELCAVGLYQGNLTIGNFAITALLVREHNRLCEGIAKELENNGSDASDEAVFRKAQQSNITAYMKVVVEDYINAFAGQKIFRLDTDSFFYEKKRWCRESPIPFHFNILYRLHGMIPDTLNGYEDLGFSAYLAHNGLVMDVGLGALFELASSQAASTVSLGNTHAGMIPAERAMLSKGRGVLASFNAHRNANKAGSSVGFDAFDSRFRDKLRKLYNGDVNTVEYAVGIFAELPKRGLVEKLGLKDDSIIGSTLMDAIAKHAFRHILSNRYMSKEFLNPSVMSQFGWGNLHDTSTVADIVKRNVPEMSADAANNLTISFDAPNNR